MNIFRLCKGSIIFSSLSFRKHSNYSVFQRLCYILKDRKMCLLSSKAFNGSNFSKHSAFFSCCSFVNSKDKTDSDNCDENTKKVLEDEEFQSILKDFAKDFGVGDEANSILEDIRKNLNQSVDRHAQSKENFQVDNMSSEQSHLYQAVSKEKYADFDETDFSVLYSYEDLQSSGKDDKELSYHVSKEFNTKIEYEKLQRGVHGVFDIEELIEVLQKEKLSDIAVISVPKELHYTDFLVLSTAKSSRHSEAVAELLKKIYKKKKSAKDPYVFVEGEKVSNWKAMDMGNIVLHIFLRETRELYDIESLWLFDEKFDSGGNIQVDPMISVIEEQMAFFNSLQQMESAPKEDS